MREPIDMLRIAAGGISMSGNLYRFFDQFDFDNILSGHGCIRVSAGGGRDCIGPCLAETFHPVIKSPRFDIVFQTEYYGAAEPPVRCGEVLP